MAPVGNFAMLKSAIAGGADAVYFGLDRFNARISADNFNKDNFAEVISYAHLRQVLVYVTFNTCIKESEFKDAINYVDFIIQNGADAIILQDMGIVSYVHDHYHDFPIHISTQVGICNLNGARFVKSLGAKRVVLARETSIQEIKRISENVDIEIEYFVQGALCVCYSGNCYFSSIVDGNSGNRGMCKQPCRKSMNLVGDNFEVKGFNLSTYDTSLIDELSKVIDSGVNSLKIEGRLRSAEYVYYACKAYKEALNKIDYQNSYNKLKTTFNRGEYSHAYFDNRKDKVIYNKTQSNIGVSIGKVVAVKGEKAVVVSNYIPNSKDGFKVLRNSEEVGSAIFNKNCNKLIGKIELIGKNIKIGDEIRLTYSENINKEVCLYEKKTPIYIHYNISLSCVQITCTINNIELSYKDFPLPTVALSVPISNRDFEAQFTKLNDTAFDCVSISGEIIEKVFYPKSIINAIRRDFVNKLTNDYLDKISIKYIKNEIENIAITRKYEVKNVVILSSFEVSFDEFKDFNVVYRPLDYSKIESQNMSTVFLYIPNYYDSLDEQVLQNIIDKNEFLGLYCDGYNGIELARKNQLKFIVGINCNVFNSNCLSVFDDCVGFVNSKELRLNETLENGMILSKGEFAVMSFVHCPLLNSGKSSCQKCSYKNLKYVDEGKREFSLIRNKINGCLFTLLNNSNIYYDEIKNNLYDFSHLSYEEIKKLLEQDSSSVTNKGHLFRGIK